MQRLRKYGVTLLATLSLVTIVLLVTGWGSAAAAQISSVLVANTVSNPVPVQATGTVPVHEQGTASVNVTNTTVPVHEQGTATVSVSGTPSVNVTNTTLPVHEQGVATTSVKPATNFQVQNAFASPGNTSNYTGFQINASLVSITSIQGRGAILLWSNGQQVFNAVYDEADLTAVGRQMVMELTQPLPIDRIELVCDPASTDNCFMRFNIAGN